MVSLRLKRVGRKKRPYYRLVAVDSRVAPQGAEIEILGHYDPMNKQEKHLFVHKDRFDYWVSCGAQPSDTVASLMKRHVNITKTTNDDGVSDVSTENTSDSDVSLKEKKEVVESDGVKVAVKSKDTSDASTS